MAPSRILILTNEPRRFEQTEYVLREFATIWRKSGLEVRIDSGSESPRDFPLAIAHVDLTRTPADYLARIAQFPVVLNGGVNDISKRFISRITVTRGDGYDGPVIIKTNLNCGGLMESLRAGRRGGFPKWIHKIRERLPWSFRSHLTDYPILDAVSKVPARSGTTPIWWSNDSSRRGRETFTACEPGSFSETANRTPSPTRAAA